MIAGKDEKRLGGFFPPGEEGNNHPIIRIAPNAQGVNGIPAITFAVTLFELIRASSAHEQAELDQQVKDGTLTTKQYADACERLTAKYIAKHRDLVKGAIASGQLPAEADILKSYDGLTEDQILARLKDSGHWQDAKDRGQRLYDGAHPSVIPRPTRLRQRLGGSMSLLMVCMATVALDSVVPIPHTKLAPEVEQRIRFNIARSEPEVITEFPSLKRVVLIPDAVKTAYAANPRGTAVLLYHVARDGTALESVIACGYAIGLMDRPAVGSVCEQVYKGAVNYDTLDPAWRCTPREHWLWHLRRDCRTRLPDMKPD